MRNLFFVALIAAALVGCSTTPTTEAPVVDKTGAGAAGAAGAQTSGAGAGGVSGAATGSEASSPLRDPNNILSKRSVYFDYDSFVVKDEYKPVVEAHARWLQGHADARMTIQGNTDERGSQRVQHRTGTEARRRAQADDGAAGRARQPDRDGELRQGKAEEPRA